jgi:hypothetical protein
MLKGKRWNLVDLKRPTDKDTPYMILESLNSEKNSSRTVHTVIINTERTKFSLGRGHDSDLRINDISVSRKHANLEYRDGKFYFVDLKSKFGTLALLSGDVELKGNAFLDDLIVNPNPIANDQEASKQTSQTFQIGRTVVTLKAKLTQPWKNKDKNSGRNIAEIINKGNNVKGNFLKDQKQLMEGNYGHSPLSNTDKDEKIQVFGPNGMGQWAHNVPVFETNKNSRSNESSNGQQQIIELDGKRYLVIQELGLNNSDDQNVDEEYDEGED